jgi:cellulose synthase/poly-beta-1,6-N-acetylglucosamine synthase-like glycosyltransferase
MILYCVLIAYLFVSCVYWLWVFMAAVRTVRAVPILAQADVSPPPTWPRLSVVIPACNEADSLEAALRSVLDQDYPELEIVLIDDRSTDGTADIVDRLAGTDPRILAIHIEQLPEGWLGKVHAMALGTAKSHGAWLLYTDADVNMAPGALRTALAYAAQHDLDHLAALPEIWPSTFLVGINVALFFRSLVVALRLWAVADPKSDAFVGIGAFNLVRRDALDRSEGLAWLRMEVGEDLGLGMMLKQSGARSWLVNGQGLFGLYWYRSLSEMANGAEKAYASAAGCSLLRVLIMSVVIVALEWSPLVALAFWRIPGFLWMGLAMLAAAMASSAVLARWTRTSWLPALLFPLAAVMSAAIVLRSGWLGYRRGGIVWRGTLYTKKQLLAGRRLRIP